MENENLKTFKVAGETIEYVISTHIAFGDKWWIAMNKNRSGECAIAETEDKAINSLKKMIRSRKKLR